jgi:hypothetical protein
LTITATLTGPTADGTGYIFTFDNAGAPYGSMTVYTADPTDAQAQADLQCQNLAAMPIAPPPA